MTEVIIKIVSFNESFGEFIHNINHTYIEFINNIYSNCNITDDIEYSNRYIIGSIVINLDTYKHIKFETYNTINYIKSYMYKIFPKYNTFYMLKNKEEVKMWGYDQYHTGVRNFYSIKDKLSNVKSIYHNLHASAALCVDGSVITWGHNLYGGDSDLVKEYLKDVKIIYKNSVSFAALRIDGSVITWGSSYTGGDSSNISDQLSSGSNIKCIYSTKSAFAALRFDGSVITWGNPQYGGDSSKVSDQLQSDINIIYSNDSAFVALKNDNTLITWGDENFGGTVCNTL
jgi:hypothetical protein